MGLHFKVSVRIVSEAELPSAGVTPSEPGSPGPRSPGEGGGQVGGGGGGTRRGRCRDAPRCGGGTRRDTTGAGTRGAASSP